MCDKRVSNNRLVNTIQPVFNRLPSTDEYKLRNARQVNHVLGLHLLDYVANCLPSTVVWCPSQRWTLQRKVLCSAKSVQLQYFCKLDNWHGEHVAKRSVKKSHVNSVVLKNYIRNSGKISYHRYSAGQKESKKTCIFFSRRHKSTLSRNVNRQNSMLALRKSPYSARDVFVTLPKSTKRSQNHKVPCF